MKSDRKQKILLILILIACMAVSACGGSSAAQSASADAAVSSDADMSADAAAEQDADGTSRDTDDAEGSSDGLQITGSMELTYAEQFTVDYCADGCTLITIGGTEEYLLVPEGMTVPSYAEGMSVICQPLSDIYLASSAVMDLFVELDALERVSFTSTSEENWSIEEAAEALSAGELTYVGKYSAPDYETLLAAGCTLAIENTMIYHQPEVAEQLENLGICVLVDHSSYESHPLGRVEWIRLYGLLCGREEEADALFAQKAAQFEAVLAAVSEEDTSADAADESDVSDGADDADETDAGENDEGSSDADDTLKVAYFYVTSAGAVNIRKPGDYITKLIAYAGGTYAFTAEDLDLDESTDNALSTMNLQFEAFYEGAWDADVLIYNSSIGGYLTTCEELIDLNALFAEFTAVQTGNVWCTEADMFQQTGAASEILEEFYAIFTGTADEQMQFFHRLQ